MRLRSSTAAKLAFAALVALCGTGVHLIADLAGLGWQTGAQHVISDHVIALGLLALACSGVLGAVGVAIARHANRDAFITDIVRALPDGGCGFRFLSLAFAGQFLVFAVTEAGEGLPIEAGDLSLGVVAALCASAIGALLVWRSQRRVMEAISGLILVLFAASASPIEAQMWKRIDAHVRIRRCRAVVFAGSRRPPPSALVIEPFSRHCRSQETEDVYIVFGASTRAVGRDVEHLARRRRHLCW